MVFIIVFIIVLLEGKNYTVVNNYSFLKEKKNEKEKRKGKKNSTLYQVEPILPWAILSD